MVQYCLSRQADGSILPIETGRWFNIAGHERYCTLRNKHEIGDEIHLLFQRDTLIIIIIIINFYGAYIVRILSSEVQQNRIIKHNREQGRAKVIIRSRDNRRFMAEMQF